MINLPSPEILFFKHTQKKKRFTGNSEKVETLSATQCPVLKTASQYSTVKKIMTNNHYQAIPQHLCQNIRKPSAVGSHPRSQILVTPNHCQAGSFSEERGLLLEELKMSS